MFFYGVGYERSNVLDRHVESRRKIIGKGAASQMPGLAQTAVAVEGPGVCARTIIILCTMYSVCSIALAIPNRPLKGAYTVDSNRAPVFHVEMDSGHPELGKPDRYSLLLAYSWASLLGCIHSTVNRIIFSSLI